MALVNLLAEEYAAKYSSEEDELLQKINLHTTKNHAHAHMLSGHVQGSFLTMLSGLLRPEKILEIGTFTGYSALCLAKGLIRGGTLHTIELREEDAAIARAYFEQSLYKSNIELHVGNAVKIIPTLHELWDIVFIDADKTGYIDYYELVLPSVKQNGIIIADNVLFHGEVILPADQQSNTSLYIHDFNKKIAQDNRVEQVIMPLRDGLMLIRKK